MTDFEVLQYEIGGIKLSEVGTMTFLQWVAKKMNNVVADLMDKQIMNELTTMIKYPPFGKMSDDSKIAIIRKLEKLGVKL